MYFKIKRLRSAAAAWQRLALGFLQSCVGLWLRTAATTDTESMRVRLASTSVHNHLRRTKGPPSATSEG